MTSLATLARALDWELDMGLGTDEHAIVIFQLQRHILGLPEDLIVTSLLAFRGGSVAFGYGIQVVSRAWVSGWVKP